MKKKYFILIAYLVCMLCFSCNKSEVENQLTELNEKETSSFDILFESSGNAAIDNQMRNIVYLSTTESIMYQDFIDDNHYCYRVCISSGSTNQNNRLTRDYFFFNSENVKPLIVDYPSKNVIDADRKVYNNCSFAAKFEDVTFDGNDDLLISLGYVGIPEWECFCLYIYKDGQYEYNNSFEKIVDYKIDSVGHLILGSKIEDALYDNPFYYYYINDKKTYKYDGNQFILSETSNEPNPSEANEYIKKALNNELSVIDEFGNSVTWEQYEYRSVSFYNDSDEYAYIDLDCDGEKEFIVNAQGYSTVLDSQSQAVYSYSFPYRSINRIREDGVFHDGGSGAEVNAFYKITFYHGIYIKNCIQCNDNTGSGYYFINNTEVSKEYYEEYSYDYLHDDSYIHFQHYDIDNLIIE